MVLEYDKNKRKDNESRKSMYWEDNDDECSLLYLSFTLRHK